MRHFPSLTITSCLMLCHTWALRATAAEIIPLSPVCVHSAHAVLAAAQLSDRLIKGKEKKCLKKCPCQIKSLTTKAFPLIKTVPGSNRWLGLVGEQLGHKTDDIFRFLYEELPGTWGDVDGKPRDGAVRMTDAPPVGPLLVHLVLSKIFGGMGFGPCWH